MSDFEQMSEGRRANDLIPSPAAKFHFELLHFHLAQGLREPQKILPVTLSLVYLKARNEEKLNKFSFP